MKKVKKTVAKPVKVARKRNRISVDLTDKQMRTFNKALKDAGNVSKADVIRYCLEHFKYI